MVRTELLLKALGWNNELELTLELLLGKGMARLDTHSGETNYWFPRVYRSIHMIDSSK